MEDRTPKSRKPRVRVLRSGVIDQARVWHDCDWCHQPIMPGDRYEIKVTAINGRLQIEKHHCPECPEDPDDERASREVEDIERWNAMKSQRNPQTILRVA